ncbi:hypothetical protein PMAYCL1PPCAC_02589, partial [Pristionchus mayeri]
YIPLDPRPDATQITEMGDLRSTEVSVTVGPLSVKEIKSMAIDPKTYVIGEIDFTNAKMAANFIVGDELKKVNGNVPQTFVHLTKMLAKS